MQTDIGTDIEKAKSLLLAGQLVAIPTETVYGLAANALDAVAVSKIFGAKNRPQFNPLIVHCASWQHAQMYVQNVPSKAHFLAERFAPGPLTFVLEKKANIPGITTANSRFVGIRIPIQPLTQQLLQRLPFPLAAPSANPSGYVSPTTAQHVMDGLQGEIPYILDGGPCPIGVESTIIGFDENEQLVLLRNGGISQVEIEKLLGEKILSVVPKNSTAPTSPGQLASHYAPQKPLYMGNVDKLLQEWKNKNVAVISFKKQYHEVPLQWQFVLSPDGNLQEAAANLFAALRTVDSLPVDAVLTEIFPNEGIGSAINDRLNRARADKK